MNLNFLQTKKVIYDFIYATMDQVTAFVSVLLSLLVLIYIFHTVMENRRKHSVNYEPMLLKLLVIFLALAFYRFFTVEIATLIVFFAKSVDSGNLGNIIQVLEAAFTKHSEMGKIKFFNPAITANTIIFTVLLIVCILLVTIASLVFEIIQFFLQALLWMMGPVAIVVSLLPMYKNAFELWLKNFIAVNFWSVIYAVLITFFHYIITEEFGVFLKESSITNLGFEVYFYFIQLLAYSVVFFVSIAFIPFYTHLILPGQSLGAMGSMMGAISSMLVTKVGGGIVNITKKISSGGIAKNE